MKKINNIKFDAEYFEDHDGIWVKDGVLYVDGYVDKDGVLCLTKKE